MTVFADSIAIDFYNGTVWVDISAYVVGDIQTQQGLGGWRPENRVALVGTLKVILNNKAKLFSPMGGDALRSLNTLTGFTRGAPMRVRAYWRGGYYPLFVGRIASIDSDDKNWGPEQTRVLAVDWMNVPGNFPMKGAAIATDQTIDSALALILARLSVQPDSTDFDDGYFTFPAIFDNVKTKTMASAELARLVASELGYLYVKGDGTLRAENYRARWGGRALDTIVLETTALDHLLLETGDHLLLEDGDKLLINAGTATAVALYDDVESINILLDTNSVLNQAIVHAYPVITDTSLKVLYSLGSPVYLPGYGTLTFIAHYTDPNGYNQASGTNMQAPVATTDYTANASENGGGTDRTGDLTVAAVYYGDTVEYTLTNGANSGLWVTKLQARGYGIYYGNSIETVVNDSASQSAYGLTAFQFDQKYRKDTYFAAETGAEIIEEYKTPRSRITKMGYLANLNENHLAAALQLDIGSLIRIDEDRSGINCNYYITDRALTIRQGGIIRVNYGVKENDAFIGTGLEALTVEFAGGAAVDAIDFGYLPRLDNLACMSLVAWVYLDAAPGVGKTCQIMNRQGGPVTGWRFYIDHDRAFRFDSYRSDAGARSWSSLGIGGSAVGTGAWHHLVVTIDNRSTTNNALMYLDGSPVSVGLGNNDINSIVNDAGSLLTVGNLVDGTAGNYGAPFDGKLYDPRIYDRILTAAEITALAADNQYDAAPLDGLLFQGLGCYAAFGGASTRAGEILDSSDRIIESAFRSVGVPHGSPVLRANP